MASNHAASRQVLVARCLLLLTVAALLTSVVESRSVRVSHLTLPLVRPSKPLSLINYTIYAPSNFYPYMTLAPAVFLLNGFNVPSVAYNRLCGQLAEAGLIVATAAEVITLPLSPGLPRAGCPAAYTHITGTHLNLLMNASLPSNNQPRDAARFQKSALMNRVMLLGHSNGGVTAAYMISGTCDTPSPATALNCDTYRPMTDSRGRNLLVAATLYEGYANITVPPGSLVAYLNGAKSDRFPNGAVVAYAGTSGCTAYLEMSGANHYALCDFVPGVNNTQVWPCCLPSATDVPGFTVTEAQQQYNIRRVADAGIAVAQSFKGGEFKKGRPDLSSLSPEYFRVEQVCPRR